MSSAQVNRLLTPVGSHLETRGLMRGAVKGDQCSVSAGVHIWVIIIIVQVIQVISRPTTTQRPSTSLPVVRSPFNSARSITARLPSQSLLEVSLRGQ